MHLHVAQRDNLVCPLQIKVNILTINWLIACDFKWRVEGESRLVEHTRGVLRDLTVPVIADVDGETFSAVITTVTTASNGEASNPGEAFEVNLPPVCMCMCESVYVYVCACHVCVYLCGVCV